MANLSAIDIIKVLGEYIQSIITNYNDSSIAELRKHILENEDYDPGAEFTLGKEQTESSGLSWYYVTQHNNQPFNQSDADKIIDILLEVPISRSSKVDIEKSSKNNQPSNDGSNRHDNGNSSNGNGTAKIDNVKVFKLLKPKVVIFIYKNHVWMFPVDQKYDLNQKNTIMYEYGVARVYTIDDLTPAESISETKSSAIGYHVLLITRKFRRSHYSNYDHPELVSNGFFFYLLTDQKLELLNGLP